MRSSRQRVYILRGVQRRSVWAVGRLGVAACLVCVAAAVDRQVDCVTVRSMVNIARLTIWSIYCSRGGGEGRADPLIVAPFIGAA